LQNTILKQLTPKPTIPQSHPVAPSQSQSRYSCPVHLHKTEHSLPPSAPPFSFSIPHLAFCLSEFSIHRSQFPLVCSHSHGHLRPSYVPNGLSAV
jgi:hypothetical protein